MPRYTVLELTETEAKILQLNKKSRKSGPQIEHALVVDFSDLPKEEGSAQARGMRLKERLKQAKITPGTTAIIIPKQNSIVRTAILPSADLEELAGMAQFEAEKFITFNAERHIVSNGILRRDGVEGSNVLITAVDRPVMDDAVMIAVTAGFEPAIAEVSSIALVRAFNQQVEIEQTEKPSSALLLNIGKTNTDISIVEDGMIQATSSRGIMLEKLLKEMQASGKSWEDVEVEGDSMQAWIMKLVKFIRQTYDFAAREHQVKAASAVYLTGEGTRVEGLSSALSLSLGVPVVLFNPAETFPRMETGTIELEALCGFSNAIGSALRLVEEDEDPKAREGRVNLLPPEVIEQQEASERRVLLMISGTMVFITLVLIYLAMSMQSEHRQMLADRYSSYNKKMDSIVSELEEKKKRLEIIDSIKTNRASPLAILDQISTYPALGSTKKGGRLVLTEFKYGLTDDVIIRGTAVEMDDISDFTSYLDKLSWEGRPIFREVGIPQPQRNELSGRGQVWNFTLNCILANPEQG